MVNLWLIYGEFIGITIYLVGGLEHEFYDFPSSWEFHHPN